MAVECQATKGSGTTVSLSPGGLPTDKWCNVIPRCPRSLRDQCALFQCFTKRTMNTSHFSTVLSSAVAATSTHSQTACLLGHFLPGSAARNYELLAGVSSCWSCAQGPCPLLRQWEDRACCAKRPEQGTDRCNELKARAVNVACGAARGDIGVPWQNIGEPEQTARLRTWTLLPMSVLLTIHKMSSHKLLEVDI